MTEIFHFRVSKKAEEFCLDIVSEMVCKFGIKRDEAIGRINRYWSCNDFVDDDDIRYHEIPEFWANDIYYGYDSRWWWMSPANLKPVPYSDKND